MQKPNKDNEKLHKRIKFSFIPFTFDTYYDLLQYIQNKC